MITIFIFILKPAQQINWFKTDVINKYQTFRFPNNELLVIILIDQYLLFEELTLVFSVHLSKRCSNVKNNE